MPRLKAPKKPINQPVVFFESLQALKAAEQRLYEADSADFDPVEYGFVEAFVCPAGDGYITDHRHAFKGADNRFYHNPQCADLTELESK